MGSSRPNIPLAGGKTPYKPSVTAASRRPAPEAGTRGPSRPSEEVRPGATRPGIKFGPGEAKRTF